MASIDKRPDRPDSPWRARWREYPGGPQRTKHFARKVDAVRHLTKVEHDLMTGAYIGPETSRTTVADFYAVWAARQPWRDSSRESVDAAFRIHILPALGVRPLGSVRRGDVESWAAGLSVAATTARKVAQYLGTMFEAAVADGLVASNPARGAKRPRVDPEPVVPFTSEELDRIWDASPDWFRIALTLGAMCGLRQGEAAGLTVDRLDLPRRSLKVDRQLVSPPRGPAVFGPPKTARSHRTVPLADVAVTYLASHLERFGTGEHGLVLHENGRPVRRQRLDDVWEIVRDAAVLPGSRYHDCRHTYASTLLSGGVSVAAAAEYLGHTPAVLLKTYAHLMPADHDRARSVVDAAFAEAAEDPLRTSATPDGH
jgi:integrase